MARRFLILPFIVLLLVACSTSKPASEPDPVDPVTEPTVVGALDEAVLQGTIEGEAAAETGRVVGRVAGLVAAVLGGPEKGETIDETIDRYRRTRDAVEITAAAIGTTKGAVEGAKRGYELDLQFAELHKLEGLEVTRPWPDQIDARFTSSPSDQLLAGIAAVFAGREQRAIQLEAAGDTAMDIRESLIDLGVPASSFDVQRNDELEDVVLRIRYAA
ncbi:MAG TPA: hypothetical protein VE974_18875 [Thermoanaerobaculia bacterium]|nr:hypothetical protein [Thermoanaerobaculia bacterium]